MAPPPPVFGADACGADPPGPDARAGRLTIGVIVAGVLVRLFLAALVPLSTEEAYHWNFGRHPDWCYLDHPPMMAWLSALTTALLGNTAWAVRLGPVLLGGAAAWMLAAAARRLLSDRAALYAVLAWEVMPGPFLASATLLPDSPMVFGWIAALLGLVTAFWGGRPAAGWLLAGAGLGIALLGKYTAGLLVPSVLLFLLLSREHRRHLLTPWPWMACLAAAALFAPVIAWNAGHDWASFRFQFARRISGFEAFDPRYALKFLGHQALSMSPLLAPVVLAAAGGGIRDAWRGDARRLFLVCVSLPTIAAFAYAAVKGTSHLIWTMPAYAGLAMLAGAWVEAGAVPARLGNPPRPGQRRTLFLAGVAATTLGLLLGGVHVARPIPGIRPVVELHGWEELARAVEAERRRLDGPAGEAFVLGLGRRFTLESALAFHTGRTDLCHGENLLGLDGLQYRYWAKPGDLKGRNAVVVLEEGHRGPRRVADKALLTAWFASWEDGPVVLTGAGGALQRTFYLVRARGYKGAPGHFTESEALDDR